MGLGGILTDIGIEADFVRDGKQTVKLGEKNYLVESALTADIAIVYAEMADPYGNLIFDKSAQEYESTCSNCRTNHYSRSQWKSFHLALWIRKTSLYRVPLWIISFHQKESIGNGFGNRR